MKQKPITIKDNRGSTKSALIPVPILTKMLDDINFPNQDTARASVRVLRLNAEDIDPTLSLRNS